MLLSMTGFGEAHQQEDALAVAVEVRTINSRYFKLSLRSGEGYSALEPQIENLVRSHIKRGTVQVNLRVERAPRPDDYRVNATVLGAYQSQLEHLRTQWQVKEPVGLDALLLLPGVITELGPRDRDAEQEWPLIRRTVESALAHMMQMRADEGRAMAADLAANCETIRIELDGIDARAGAVVDAYREKMLDRVTKAMADYSVSLEPADLVREVCIYAERSDISEEIVRLRSHLEQFASIMASEESSGRKLEFLTQEMFRETNTIGSKASDIQISRHVIEIKAAIERIREMIQNVE